MAADSVREAEAEEWGEGLIDRFKVMVGGAPANRQWAEDIGAHGYAENAMAAVKAVKELSASR